MVAVAARVLGLVALLVRRVASHGAVVFPPPRNAVDSDVMPWAGAVPRDPPGVESATGWCPAWSEREGKVTGQNGQSCFWVRRVTIRCGVCSLPASVRCRHPCENQWSVSSPCSSAAGATSLQ